MSKMIRMLLTSFACLFLFSSAVFPLGKKDSKTISGADLYETARTGQTVEITGRVRLVGNMPFTQLVLSDDADHDWYITPDEQGILKGFEQPTVTLRGTVELLEMALADNTPLGTRRILKNIMLIR